MPRRRPDPRPSRAAVTVRRPDPRAWHHALYLTGGNPRRLEVLPDGTVMVHNKQIR